MVQVHHDEGIAIHIDPESCAAAREGNSEALTGERAGQPSSRESTLFPGADVVPLTEGNTDGRDIASAQTTTAAEPVERRAGAKGNAYQQSTDRAQNRATVSQALVRVRQ